MKTLILGGCGFIGSHIVDALLANKFSVSVLDRGPEKFRRPLNNVNYFLGDYSDPMLLAEALTGIDVVFHLISTTFPSTANLNPQADINGNLIGTLGLIDTMISLRTKRLVYLSSGGTVYGRTEHAKISETHPLTPINSYGIVKVAVEHYLNMYQTTHKLSSIAIRAANPFGERQSHSGIQGVIGTFLKRVYDNEPIELWGDGSVIRDYLYVKDLAQLCVLAANSDIQGSLNAGSGVGRSVNEIIQHIAQITGKPIKPVFKPGRMTDVKSSILDITKADRLLGWKPITPFECALSQTWQWMQHTNSKTTNP